MTDGQAASNTTVDEFVRSQITPSHSIAPLDRRPPSRPHLLEVSAAQQRQQDTLRDSSSARTSRPQHSTEMRGAHSGETGSVGSQGVAEDDTHSVDRGDICIVLSFAGLTCALHVEMAYVALSGLLHALLIRERGFA